MIPYFPEPAVSLGSREIHAYSITAVAAIIAGASIALHRARRQGIGLEETFRLWFWMYVSAMLGAHLYAVLVDDFALFAEDPARIFRLDAGISSAGAIAAGLIAGLAWCRFRRLSLYETLRRLDIMSYAIPFAWMLGRLGCTLAHDHPGVPSTSWIAVNFPDGPRLDLGLIEFLFLIAVVVFFLLLDRRPWPAGFYFGLYGVLYGGFRMVLNNFQPGPIHFPGLAGFVVGVLGWLAMLAVRSRAATVRE